MAKFKSIPSFFIKIKKETKRNSKCNRKIPYSHKKHMTDVEKIKQVTFKNNLQLRQSLVNIQLNDSKRAHTGVKFIIRLLKPSSIYILQIHENTTLSLSFISIQDAS